MKFDGITKTLERNDFCNDIDGYGYMARKCAIMIIRKIAECMEDDETLSELTERINDHSVKNYEAQIRHKIKSGEEIKANKN